MLKIRWLDPAGNVQERKLTVPIIDFGPYAVVFKDPNGRVALIVPNDRLIDAEEVPQ